MRPERYFELAPNSFKNKVVNENSATRQATLGGSLNRCSHRVMYQAGSSIFLVNLSYSVL